MARLASGNEIDTSSGCEDYVDMETETELLYVAKIYSSTLFAVDIGHTPALPWLKSSVSI